MSTYNSLLEDGWRMREIDEMDILGFLHIRAWKASEKKQKTASKQLYIDEVWKNFKP